MMLRGSDSSGSLDKISATDAFRTEHVWNGLISYQDDDDDGVGGGGSGGGGGDIGTCDGGVAGGATEGEDKDGGGVGSGSDATRLTSTGALNRYNVTKRIAASARRRTTIATGRVVCMTKRNLALLSWVVVSAADRPNKDAEGLITTVYQKGLVTSVE